MDTYFEYKFWIPTVIIETYIVFYLFIQDVSVMYRFL